MNPIKSSICGAALAVVVAVPCSAGVADAALVRWSQSEKTLEASMKTVAGKVIDLAGRKDRASSATDEKDGRRDAPQAGTSTR